MQGKNLAGAATSRQQGETTRRQQPFPADPHVSTMTAAAGSRLAGPAGQESVIDVPASSSSTAGRKSSMVFSRAFSASYLLTVTV